ncbi:MAG TPA: hypothetical protein VFQ00_00870 [Terriglobales bacterium]|nr:hypothetical protein [Terriglobales bacterium]
MRPSVFVGKFWSDNNSCVFTKIYVAVLLACSFAVLNCGGGGDHNPTPPPPPTGTPQLAATVATQANFSSGEQGASYSISVKNNGNAGTSGTVTVVDPPDGFSPTAIAGTGWSCTLSTTTCTRSDSLAPGQSYPPIVVTGNVTAPNGTPVDIALSVSGGGMTAAVSSKPSLNVVAAALAISEMHTGNFNLGQQGATHTVTVQNGASAGPTAGTVTVSETSAAGETLVSMAGSGWTCPGSGGANTCDRTDALASGASYPALTVTLNVAANAASPEVNQVAVSGGGMAAPATTTDSVGINLPDLAIAESHNGTFTAGGNGTFDITVSNAANGAGAGPSGGTITVTDTLPATFTFVSAGGLGWSCGAAAQVVTCTNASSLNPGDAAAAIGLQVSVNSNASGRIGNSVSVSGFGDGDAANDSASDSITFAPDLAMAESHVGNFGAGSNGVLTLSVNNAGNGPTTDAITVTDTLDSSFNFVSGNASGWSCAAASQNVTCTNAGPLAPGASSLSIPLIVAVSGTASTSDIVSTANVATTGDSNSANDSASESVHVLGTADLPASISITVPGAGAGGAIFAGGNSETIAIAVAHDQAGDVLTPTLTLNGDACTSDVCGTLGSIGGTSPNYTLAYTPPASLADATTITITVSSSLTTSFTATANFNVFPAGTRVVKMTGVGGGPGTKPVNVTVFNDPSGPSAGSNVQLLAAGYACPPVAAPGTGTTCGTLVPTAAPTSGTTVSGQGTTGIPFTSSPFTYTPPTQIPNPPYDHPMILAASNADNTKIAAVNFALGLGLVLGGPINNASRLNTALTGTTPVTIFASFGEAGVNKATTWTLTADGADCQPDCGTLGVPVYTRNGNSVTAAISYTPPATVPAAPAKDPTLTVTSVDVNNSFQPTDSVQFTIKDGTCGSGNNGVLNGQYAFLAQGGSAGQGYEAFIGSFTADGNGNITGGTIDVNHTTGATTGLSIDPSSSSYSIGSDNRGCLTLANESRGVSTYRIAVGAMDSTMHATQGALIRFDDNTGLGQRTQGILLKQDTAAFANSSISGNYVIGFQGVQSAGQRLAVVGVVHADGAGNLNGFDTDAIDAAGNADLNDTSGSGTYNIDTTTGRGTLTTTVGGTTNAVVYVVDSTEFLYLSTDFLSSQPILSGEARLQTGGPFMPNSFDNNAYVTSLTGINADNGGNATAVGRIQFGTSGAFTGNQDVNDNGTLANQLISDSYTIAANGRAVNPAGDTFVYAISPNSAVILDNDASVPFGYAQLQAAGPFSNATLSGQAFFGGGAPNIGSEFDSGVTTFDGTGSLGISVDGADAFSLKSGTDNFSYAIDPATGKLTISFQSSNFVLGYVVSNSKIIFMTSDPQSPPSLLAGHF